MPDVAAVEIEAGRMAPLPDCLPYLGIAEKWATPPWELLEGTGPPRHWWIRAELTVEAARAEAERQKPRTKR